MLSRQSFALLFFGALAALLFCAHFGPGAWPAVEEPWRIEQGEREERQNRWQKRRQRRAMALLGEASAGFSGMPKGGALTPVRRDKQIILPEGYDPSKKYPLLVGLHGLADSAWGFSRVWREEMGITDCICLYPQGPYEIEYEGRSYWSWLPTDGGETELATSIEHIAAQTRLAMKKYSVDPQQVYLFGLSQGGAMTYLTAQEHPELFDGYAVFAGAWPLEFIEMDKLAEAKDSPWLVMHQRVDEVLNTAEHFGVAQSEMQQAGFSRAQFLEYASEGHLIILEQAEDFADWLDHLIDPGAAKLREGAAANPAAVLRNTRASEEELISAFQSIGQRRMAGFEERLALEARNMQASRRLRLSAASALRRLGGAEAALALATLEPVAEVVHVFPGSQAETAGIMDGDVLLKYGGEDVQNFAGLEGLKAERPEGEAVEALLLRGEEEYRLRLQNGMLGVLLEESIR